MELTAENYYSPEANAEYMSVSQFKSFAGTDGKLACEAEAMAELRGEWEMKKTTALMVGSYVDSYFEEHMSPGLTPRARDSARPCPLIRNNTLNIGALVQKKEDSLLSRAEDKKEKKGK